MERLRRVLPKGGTLPAHEWEQRHRALVVLLWLNVIGLSAYGALRGYGFGHTALHAGALLGCALVGSLPRLSHLVRGCAVSLGLLTAAALLVHVTHGLIESHFYFFVMIVLLTLYEDWRPFLLAVAYVLLHHGVVGMLDAEEVFNNPEAWAEPWRWAALHALFVAGAGAAAIIAWRLNENVRERMLAAQALLEDAAMVDSLTGLPNRRRLMAELDALSANPQPPQTLLAMFDLDGFKNYNDTFGHAAGDALLTRLGRQLDDAASPEATAFRLGGDEFCLLAPAAGLDVAALLERAGGAMSAHGDGFAIGCSHGAVRFPGEAATTEEALQLADQRMYVHKTGGRPSAGRQAGDALLRALEERDPHLGEHLGGVAGTSEAVARELGLTDEQCARVRQAAELHDIGKVAIPDAILLKPGPLNDDERDFIRRHTVVGARICSAAPSLAPVARLVRSSHEWVDGTGYPDGLSGEEIPLGSRIVSVCDAFDAMVSHRPYRDGVLSDEQALAELRRCAGTQFDATIVEAFHAVMARRRAGLTTA